jgi:hypothetical protein
MPVDRSLIHHLKFPLDLLGEKGQGLSGLIIFEPMNPDGIINFNRTEAMK